MKTILLVDDERESPSFTDILARSGYEVITVPDGLSALSIIRTGILVDLIITDYRVSGMDDFELLSALKLMAPVLPKIILTAHGSIETYLKASSLGVFEYIHKPVRSGELRRIVAAAVDREETFTAPELHLAACGE